MSIPETLRKLTELFETLGAPDAESWARSQIREGIPQLYRFLFLRQAWSRVASDTDHSWIDGEIRRAHTHCGEPFSGLGAAMERCKTLGVQSSDIVEIVRCREAQLLFAICYLLENPCFGDVPEEVKELSWGLFPLEEGLPGRRRILGLHESVLETDPTGREMRPKNV